MANGAHKSPWPATLVALAFIALVAMILLSTLPESGDVDGFLKIWAGVGTLVGVVTGAIPSFFFKNEADSAKSRALSAESKANEREVELEVARTIQRETEKANADLDEKLETAERSLHKAEKRLDDASRRLDNVFSTVDAMTIGADGGRERPHEQDLAQIRREIEKISTGIGS